MYRYSINIAHYLSQILINDGLAVPVMAWKAACIRDAKERNRLKPPYEWKSSSDWDPDPKKDIPEFPDEFFLCHWEHPEEKYSRLLRAMKLTLRDVSQKSANLGVPQFINWKWKAALGRLRQ